MIILGLNAYHSNASAARYCGQSGAEGAGVGKRPGSVVVPRLQEIDAVFGDAVHNPVLLRQPS